jgi:hypothetical protein
MFMIRIFRSINKLMWWMLALAGILVLGILAYGLFYSGKTIYDLLNENKTLKQAITNLTREDVTGYAKVLSQGERDGKLFTKILFVVTDRDDMTRRMLEKEFEIEGDVVFFDALIVRFGKQMVLDGKERALFLWRRVYGEKMPPESGFPIDARGAEPARYAELCNKLSVRDRAMFWTEIWNLSDDPNRLREAGIQAIYGNAVYKKVKPGLIYRFKIDATGGFFPDTVPDL